MKKLVLTLAILLFGTSVLAGGSIFGGGGGGHRTSNPDGVDSIGVYICGSLKCPDVILKKGDCDSIPHTVKKYGVCMCEVGYIVKGEKCMPCPEGTYRPEETDTKCIPCPGEHVATCDVTGKPLTCVDGYVLNANNTCVSVDTGVCPEPNPNVYLSYNENPCEVETPHKGDPNMECIKNSDCSTGEFCNLTSASHDCTKPDTGICEPITNSDYMDATVTGLGSVRRSNIALSWWAAQNWCKAQGKSLIDVRRFQVYKTIDKNIPASELLTPGAGTWSLGCADGEKCGYWSYSPYNSMWDGNTLIETAGDADGLYKDRYSPVLISLRQEFNSNTLYFWTSSDYSSSNLCYVFLGNLDGASIDYSDRNYNFHALCE